MVGRYDESQFMDTNEVTGLPGHKAGNKGTAQQPACCLGLWDSWGQEPAQKGKAPHVGGVSLSIKCRWVVCSRVQQTRMPLLGLGHSARLHPPGGLKADTRIDGWRGAGLGAWLFKKSGDSLTLLGLPCS